MKKFKSEPVKTALIITVGFLVVYLITKGKWALGIALIVGLTGILSTYLTKKLEFLWMKLTWLLSMIVPNILLSLIFFLFLFPVAFLSRLFGQKDMLGLKNTKKSMFKETNKKFSKASFEKPW
jgi:hypothetical protein